jgi:hypothetical protein
MAMASYKAVSKNLSSEADENHRDPVMIDNRRPRFEH